MARREGDGEGRRGPRPEEPGSDGEGFVEGDSPKENQLGGMPPKFLERLEAAGLRLNGDGTALRGGGKAGSMGTPEQLQLAQAAFERFGIGNNPFFDPSRVAFSGQMDGKDQPRFVNLDTGVFSTGTGVASDTRLELMRARTGWTPEGAFAAAQKANTQPNGYIPQAFQTLEGYQRYINAARANYLEPPDDEPAEQATDVDYSPLDTLDDNTLTGLSDAASKLLRSRQNRSAAQSNYASYFDLDEEF